MATPAPTSTRGRVRRVVRWLFRSRRALIVSVSVELTLTLVSIPWMVHLAVGLIAHLLVARLLHEPS